MQTTEVNQSQSQQIDSLTDWINKNFVENQPKCVKDNQAQFICINQHCKGKNPFICFTKNCECRKQHKVCSIRTIQFFLEEMKQKQISNTPYSELEGIVHRQINGLIQKIAMARDKILQKIRKNQIGQSFKKIQEQKIRRLKELLKQQISGSVIFNILSQQPFDSSQSNQSWFNIFQDQFAQIFSQFEENKLQPFYLKLNNLIFQPNNRGFKWSLALNNLQIQVNGNNLTSNGYSLQNSRTHKVAMLQPGISKFVGKIIKWKIKILKIAATQNNQNTQRTPQWLGIGVVLRQSLRKNNFIINEDKNQECYMIANNQTVLAALDLDRNLNIQYGIKFVQNEIIEIKLDTIKWNIRFKNLSTLKSTELKIMRVPQIDKDEYHIFVAFTNKGDSVQIISPIETSLEKYQI